MFLGLREDADLEAFRAAASRPSGRAISFDPERFLQAHPAEQHRLYLIPGGTPHASGAGSLVLEISATPYLYTLRFYDWLRRNLDGELRPVHLDHAFANLDPTRRGESVRARPGPGAGRQAERPGFAELSLGELDELFFAVDRLDFEDEVAVETRGRFHVLNLVAGEEIDGRDRTRRLTRPRLRRDARDPRERRRATGWSDDAGRRARWSRPWSSDPWPAPSSRSTSEGRTCPRPRVDVGSAAVVSASRVRTELVSGSPGRSSSTGSATRRQPRGRETSSPRCRGAGTVRLRARDLPARAQARVALRGRPACELAVALSLAQAQVRFVNDAEAFLLGEWWAGAARGHDRAIGITLGTGLGSAFLEHGRIVRTGAGVPREGALYRLPFRGAPVEERISRGALLARYGEADIDVAEIALRARDGEPRAREAFDTLANDLAAFLRPWLEAFAPSCLVVGGSIARSWDLLEGGLDPLRDTVAALAPADRIDEAALLGAARHAVTEGAA